MAVNFIPDNFTAISPYLVVEGAAAAIDHYKAVFGAVEALRLPGPDGSVMHAELRISDAVFMLGEANPQRGARGPKSVGGTPVTVVVYVADVDATMAKAVAQGAVQTMAPQDMFWGDRMGSITDPFGHNWSVATHIEDVTPAEMESRFRAMVADMAAGS